MVFSYFELCNQGSLGPRPPQSPSALNRPPLCRLVAADPPSLSQPRPGKRTPRDPGVKVVERSGLLLGGQEEQHFQGCQD